MHSILVLGAGRSSVSLIDYLIEHSPKNEWSLTIADVSLSAALQKTNKSSAKAIAFDVQQESSLKLLQQYDVIISMLPAMFHPIVAKKCLEFKKHLLTASYVSDELKMLDDEARRNGLLFLNECGLDPGIDHMSAMQVIDKIKNDGGDLYSFESFTGGLIAPDTDPDNPWRYKFTWNPRNVVMAGQATARFLQSGEYKYIPYQQLFKRVTEVTVPGYGDYEGYANRDSLAYRELYGLQKIETMQRGTLRNKGFCSAWDIFVQLGCTDDSYAMEDVVHMTHHDFVNSFLGYHAEWSVEEKIAHKFHLKLDGPELSRLNWSGMFDNEPVGLDAGTPAKILEHILNKRWRLDVIDKDMIVMWHRFRYKLNGRDKEIQSSLVALGDDATHTAMAKTVGLPLGIAARLLLQEKIKLRGVVIPTVKEIYEPILSELQSFNIRLTEN
jgi:saccharopine dehydrogenase-like NADP-dependent oxidoreductase